MYTVAERMSGRAAARGLAVKATRRWRWHRLDITDGLWCGNRTSGSFEPVRRRAMFRARWTEVQPVQRAASRIGDLLRERADAVDGSAA